MRRLLVGIGSVIALTAVAAPAGTFPWRGAGPSPKPHPATEALREYTAAIRTNLGEIPLSLEPDGAPNAVRMFVKLAQRGAYDGTRFSCVFKDRMIVGGALQGRDKGDATEALTHESTPVLSVTAGAIVMDRTPGGDNCPARFLIILTDQTHLDGDYTVFGELTKDGLAVAKRIGAVATRDADGSPAPVEDVVIEQVLVTKKPSPSAKEGKKP